MRHLLAAALRAAADLLDRSEPSSRAERLASMARHPSTPNVAVLPTAGYRSWHRRPTYIPSPSEPTA